MRRFALESSLLKTPYQTNISCHPRLTRFFWCCRDYQARWGELFCHLKQKYSIRMIHCMVCHLENSNDGWVMIQVIWPLSHFPVESSQTPAQAQTAHPSLKINGLHKSLEKLHGVLWYEVQVIAGTGKRSLKFVDRRNYIYIEKFSYTGGFGPVAKWIRRYPPKVKTAGSSPAGVIFLY